MCVKFCLAAESAERKVEEARPDDQKFDTWDELLKAAENVNGRGLFRNQPGRTRDRAASTSSLAWPDAQN